MDAARPWRRAGYWLLFLGPFFFLTYGMANWWTGQLPHVVSFVYGWERQIPFIAWTIIPYMSIDALYAGSLFLCVTRAELDTHALRLLAATVFSIAGFLLFPLQFSFTRPPVDGFNGVLFDALTDFDGPFNQAPSLHISLLGLLWLVYARHMRGPALWLIHSWFALIGISVFTTYQHHVIDGIGGVLVAVLCVYLVPDAPLAWRGVGTTRSIRLAGAYCGGALTCWMLAAFLGGWSWILAWPGTSLLLVALAYGRVGDPIFQKHGGRTQWAARALLLPYQSAAWLSSRWFTRNVCSEVEVVPGIWIGRAPSSARASGWKSKATLDLTAEFDAGAHAGAPHYRCVPMLDLVAPSEHQLATAIGALEALQPHAPVLVHCALGYSRSALVVAGWLLRRGIVSTSEQAIALVREARPPIVLGAAHQRLLERCRDG